MKKFYESQLSQPVGSLTVSSDGRLVAVLSCSNVLKTFDFCEIENPRTLGEINLKGLISDLKFQCCDLTFNPETNDLIVVGETQEVVGKYTSSSLTLLVLSHDGQSLKRRILVEVDPPYSSPIISSTNPPMLLVGTGCGIVCIDLETGEECGRLENDDEFVAPHGIVPINKRSNEIVVAWMYQSGSRLSIYRKSDDNEFYSVYEFPGVLPFFAWGAKFNQHGNKLAVTLGKIYPEKKHNYNCENDLVLGEIRLYDLSTRQLLSAIDVNGQLKRDTHVEKIDQLRPSLSSGTWVETIGYVPKSHLSNPVFLSNNRVAFGMPSGSIRTIDDVSGDTLDILVSESPIVALASSPAGFLCVGCSDGSIVFLEQPNN